MRPVFQTNPPDTAGNLRKVAETNGDIGIGYERSKMKKCALKSVQTIAHGDHHRGAFLLKFGA